MNKRELDYRKWLNASMGGRWHAAIHVENHLNPGVPDMSYVMVAPGHETGWLELKAAGRMPSGKPLHFKVEPSQHQWMIKYAHRVPTHFLVKVATMHYLVDGQMHSKMSGPITEDDLNRLAISVFTDDNLVSGLTTTLSGLTRRDRNGS